MSPETSIFTSGRMDKLLDKIGLLEALLFAATEPIKMTRLLEVLSLNQQDLDILTAQYAESLKCSSRGVRLRMVAEGLQLVTKPEAAELVAQLSSTRQYRLSKPTLEVLAIVAYKQPITRAEIEDIRGVKCERALITLTERNLVAEVGRKDAVGRPILYGTTDSFLQHFNLGSLRDLPPLGQLP